VNGVPNVAELHITGQKGHFLVIFDDLSSQLYDSPEVINLFKNISSHENISIGTYSNKGQRPKVTLIFTHSDNYSESVSAKQESARYV
jgi:NOL1/NOP2/fmu family ribosome biogenesis protein